MANKRKNQSLGKRLKSNLKRYRMKEAENVNPTSSKRIVDINDDCLERVFEYLEFRDLINVAEANKHLKVAAEMVFVRKLKKRLIEVRIKNSSGYPEISIYDDAICIRVSLLAVRAIRLFGQRIPKIHLRVDDSDFLFRKLFTHINEYCHKTLNVLKISGRYSDIFGGEERPFENVEKFESRKGILGPGYKHFSLLFPRLRQLEFKDNDMLDSKYICETFPNLESFTFNYRCKKPTGLIDFKRITTLNPQIQSFAMDGYKNLRIWEVINTELKNLNSIFVCYSPEHVERLESPPILFNNVEIFKVRCNIGSSTISPIDVFSFKRLRSLTVRCWNEQLDEWLDFVLAHPTIEEFVIDFMETYVYLDVIKEVHQKLDKVSQNTKSITFRMGGDPFLLESSKKSNRLKLLTFLKAQKWFNKFSVAFGTNEIFEMEDFLKEIPQMKNYNITKHILIDDPHVDFEKCE